VVVVGPTDGPRDVAENIAQKVKKYGADALVMMNVELKIGTANRQAQRGVEILKWLRLSAEHDMAARSVHCVMYGFRDLEQLLREEPKNLILTSPGTSFRRLPLDGPTTLRDLRRVVQLKAPVANRGLDCYVRVGFTLPDERHSWANEWAARQMCRVSYGRNLGTEPAGRPEIQPVAKEELRDAVYLFNSIRQDDLSADDSEEIRRVREIIRNHLGRKKILVIDDQGAEIGEDIGLGWHHVYATALEVDRDSIRCVTPPTGLSLDAIRTHEEKLAETDRQLAVLPWRSAAFEELQMRQLRLLATLRDALGTVMKPRPACVLLDLRLDPGDQDRTAAEMSGAMLLRVIRRCHPAVPVIMTTASNKVTTLQEMERVGADAYWVKQGVDENRTERETVANYRALLRLVSQATGPEYQFLHRVTAHLERVRNSGGSLWWEEERWTREVLAKPRRDSIFGLLDDAILSLREYLRQTRLGIGYRISPHDEYTVWSVMQHLGKVLEEVHRWDRVSDPDASVIGRTRADWFGFHLYKIRNEVSHLTPALNLRDWSELQRYVANIAAYVSNRPAMSLKPDRRLAHDANRSQYERSCACIDWLLRQSGFRELARVVKWLDEQVDND
jgi:CheY-like chemotaxis protein